MAYDAAEKMEHRHESQGCDDVTGDFSRAGQHRSGGRPHHAAAAHQWFARGRQGRWFGLVGIVTEGDFLRRAETGTQRRRPRWLEYLVGPGRLADEYTRSHGRKVYEIMTFGALTVTEDTPLDEVVRLMEKRRIKRLPVVRGTAVVGIVSRANLVHALAGLAREVKPTAASDQAIHDRIVAELAGQSWAPTALINVIVRDGVVELWGAITDERERAAIIVAAENAPGVKGVNDHLAWVEPMSGMAFSPSDEGMVQAKAS